MLFRQTFDIWWEKNAAMPRDYPPGMPWAIIQLKNERFAIASRDVSEMLRLPEVTRVPGLPDHIRGVISLRGRVLPLIDLRKRLGMVSAEEDIEGFERVMAQREQDHRNWLAELEASVRERRKFNLTTDPHQCAFGKWYDTYRPDNVWVGSLLRKFEEPHQRIHGAGETVRQLVSEARYEQAARLIALARETLLSSMMVLFANLKDLVREVRREIAVVLAGSGGSFAVCADAAVSVEKLAEGSLEPLPAQTVIGYHGLVQRAARRIHDSQVLLVIEADRLLPGSSSQRHEHSPVAPPPPTGHPSAPPRPPPVMVKTPG